MSLHEQFMSECVREIAVQGRDPVLEEAGRNWFNLANARKYSYHFSWLGRPIIQYPQDIIAMQELIWLVQPDLIVECGIAHGGSLIFFASMLELNAACGGPQDAMVIGVDVDIRSHNREAIETHPMSKRISMIEGSSVSPEVIRQVTAAAAKKRAVLVSLDSNHTHDHVLAELNAYAPLTSPGSYCVVFDTVIEHMPPEMFADRAWGPGNSPQTAVSEYLKNHPEFEVELQIEQKLLITVAPGGFLRRRA